MVHLCSLHCITGKGEKAQMNALDQLSAVNLYGGTADMAGEGWG